MGELKLKRTADGRPHRLMFQAGTSAEARQVRFMPGCSTDRGMTLSFPLLPEPHLREVLALDCVTPTKELDQWANERRNHAFLSIILKDQVPKWLPGVSFDGQLRDYQAIAVEWLAHNKRCILGDDMGLGKTITAVALADRVEAKNVLVVAPSDTVKLQWEREIRKWSTGEVTVALGPRKKREEALEVQARWTIVNPAMLRPANGRTKGYPILHKKRWDVVIADEFQRFQGRHAQQSMGLAKLRTKYLVGLTGTPVWNKVQSLWKLLNVLYPRTFTSFWKFVRRFCYTRQTEWAEEIGDVRPDRLVELQELLAPILLRRKSEDVLEELPPAVHIQVPYLLEPAQKKLYRELSAAHKAAGAVAGGYSELRMLCGMPQSVVPTYKGANPKLDQVQQIVSDEVEAGKQVIVFTWHKLYAKKLSEVLKTPLLVSGDVPGKDRTDRVQAFRDGTHPVIVATIPSLGEGADLPNANAVVMAEMDWTPALNHQAWKRAHRFGQKDSVRIYWLHAKGTVEEAVMKVAQEKQEVADEVLAMDLIHREMSA